MNRRFLPALACAITAAPGMAASPQLAGISPRGGQRGTEVVLLFNGANLNDTQEVIGYGPGIEVKSLEVISPTQVKVTVAVAVECPLGEYAFRLRTATGVSDLRTFWVGALPVIDEVEPNDGFDKPQTIPLNVTVHGSIGNEDQDFFALECKKGQRLAVEVEGQRLGGGLFDPYVAILDAKRFELATSDDHPRFGQDGGCAVIIPEDGTYLVQVRESAYGNGSAYRLHVGTFPAPTAVIPAGGRPGQEIEFHFVGDPAGLIRQKVRLPDEPDPTYRLHCQTPDGISPTGFPVRVADLPQATGEGENTSGSAAAVLPVPGAADGVLAAAGESRWYKFAARKGQALDILCFARRLGSPLDPVIHVMETSGKYLVGNDDTNGPDSYLRFNPPQDGEFFLWVHDHLQKGGPGYVYRFEITEVRPEVVLTVAKVDGNNPANQDRQCVAVPKGNRFAALVNVTRKDFSGPLEVSFGPLPPGIALNADRLDGGQSALPVVFEAAPDAPTGGILAAITATRPDRPTIPARTSLDVPLNVGNNQTVFWRYQSDRVAMAVTDPAPFAIQVAEPQAPLPRGGSMSLRVTAKRADGFAGPITVQPLWNPPGVGIQGSATIPEGQTEVALPMNAAGNAPTRAWKTAVIASADSGNGIVWVSSQLFGLEVAPPLLTVKFQRSATEQGQPAQVFGKVTGSRSFDGEATISLQGLPPKVEAPELKVLNGVQDVTFSLTTDPATPTGKHKLFAQALVRVNGEALVQSLGEVELRIDTPLPQPTAEAKPQPSEPSTPAEPAPKRLSRLEQLRQEQAMKSGAEGK